MVELSRKERRVLEVMLIIVCIGLTCLLANMHGFKMVILYLFFLPVVLAAFYLGRYSAGVLALFCVICSSLVTLTQTDEFTSSVTPLILGLAIMVWAAVLGLTALLTGSLSDDRLTKAKELHEAYVGVVEVLAQYLQSAHPRLKARSVRVAELSQQVAAELGLSPRQIDDIRVAALLFDVGKIEVTTRMIRRAVEAVDEEPHLPAQGTFQGMDLMLSLGTILSGVVPLLRSQTENSSEIDNSRQRHDALEVPVGARIIRIVRNYLALADGGPQRRASHPNEVIQQLCGESTSKEDDRVLAALLSIVFHGSKAAPAPAIADGVTAAAVGQQCIP
jgi:hypothetical protein